MNAGSSGRVESMSSATASARSDSANLSPCCAKNAVAPPARLRKSRHQLRVGAARSSEKLPSKDRRTSTRRPCVNRAATASAGQGFDEPGIAAAKVSGTTTWPVTAIQSGPLDPETSGSSASSTTRVRPVWRSSMPPRQIRDPTAASLRACGSQCRSDGAGSLVFRNKNRRARCQ